MTNKILQMSFVPFPFIWKKRVYFHYKTYVTKHGYLVFMAQMIENGHSFNFQIHVICLEIFER
jgi:hypothetical protein